MDLEDILKVEFITEKVSEFNELTNEEYREGSEGLESEGLISFENSNEHEYDADVFSDDVLLNKTSKHKKKERFIERKARGSESKTERVLQTINYESSSFGKLSEETQAPILDWPGVDNSMDTKLFEEDTQEEEMKYPSRRDSSEEFQFVATDSSENTNLVMVRFTTTYGETMTSKFKVSSKMYELKERVSRVFNIPINQFDLSQGEVECQNLMPLSDFIVAPGPVELKIESVFHDRYHDPGDFSCYRVAKTVLTARVPLDVGGTRLKTVYMQNHCLAKEWLGGYRNKITKAEYHHAYAQTVPKKRHPRSFPRLSQQTQTGFTKEKQTETGHHVATQMWRPDLYIPTVSDRIVKTNPDRFLSGKQMGLPKQRSSFPFLTASYNRTLSRRRIRSIENSKRRHCDNIKTKNEARRVDEQLDRNKRLIIDSTFPINREDFYLLYLLIGKWWRGCHKKLTKVKKGAALKVAFSQLLEKEVDLIWMIERKRIKAKGDILRKQQMHFLEVCARPLIFRDKKGVMSSVDALDTQQAREQLEMISSYLNPEMARAQRIDVICTLKEQLKIYGSYENMNEVLELLDRECHMLLMGVKRKDLKFLQKQVILLLLKRLQSPSVNPAFNRYERPCIPKTDTKHYRCRYCGRMKHACDYAAHARMTSFHMCASCVWIMNVGQERINFTPFARMLSDVRQSEMMKCCSSAVCYLIQTVGMQYLVSQIWLCKSILSAKTDLNRLRIVRFRKEEDWSPWNCILLTVEECVVHSAIKDIYQFYNKDLLDMIHWRHLRARNHFLPLLLNDRFMQESKLWPNVQDTGLFLHPSHVEKFAESQDFEYYG